MSADVLVNLSGGVDSAWCMWQALRAGQDVLAHHIRLHNHEGRQKYEAHAVRRICDWYGRQRLPGRWKLVQTTVDYGDVRRIVRDWAVWGWWTGVLLTDPKHAHRTVVVSSYRMSDPDDPEEQRRRQIVKAVAGFEPDWSTPLAGMTKQDVVRSMPPGLLDCCWWCRRPTVTGKPCGRCRTCRQMQEIR